VSVSRESMVVFGVATAIAFSGCDSGGSEDAIDTGTETSGTTTVSVGPPSDLEAKARLATVRLRWSPPAEAPAVQGYGVYRNGSLLQGVAGGETTFIDDEVKPGKTYRYEVQARAEGGVSESASAKVKVPVPPLRAARVVGDFAVTAKLISKSGYTSYSNPTFGWHFTPRCRAGACDVEWRDIGHDRIHAKLERKGVGYEGHYSGPFLAECSGTPTTSSVTLSLRIDKARPLAGEWRATRLVGTLSNSESAQLGCVSSSASLKVTAKLTGVG
jgi:hypothetical protein